MVIFPPVSRPLSWDSWDGFRIIRCRGCEPNACQPGLGGSFGQRRSGQEGGAMDTPVVSLVAVNSPTQEPGEFVYIRRVRTRLYALAGLAISGWMGFFV